ncbi:MAG: GNAT family N-acetyltransferase [Zetaproteobacteria bacterium CG_4_9_14_3_um_filter_49_83]|nr:MAG: GNAT family N-acetyltransferase [Zetaproteobacteria bacterium CG1_02_49_23]PIQ33769.1 MAG: GNAT family N-acetyltransferase [Zetaproteobacteria bacterium CG17_big_fil_post_rev_8_21_14_2_50_50_13]PIV30730.1 MAG: GNAT family N-acetyltransferase [Zetaproteobacteria bacterium CG02_land_8_20_14_3_00_50_9]PIY55087.1 MAG: GNAT family N-acetyltransferase [Zetaproteobacteria bacterium CG_4_10_14_0_8_um_filter_49_80]PJA36553.1 MAG: GNAT family N-acetyltransferase [Zetaproteobacteria bacterium CG_4
MQENNYEIRTMNRQEVDLAIEWAATEGWNPGINDAECFYAADPHGFMIGVLNGEPIAVISAIKYGESFGFLGFYMVKPEYRGKGFGIQIWHAALAYLADRNIGLDGVIAQQNNYMKSGFKLAYRNIRYEGFGGLNITKHPDVIELSSLPLETVASYDRAFFPDHRTPFIAAWINQPGSHALGILEHDKLAGYGVIRQCHTGYKIGPLFADSPAWAEVLFLSLIAGLNSTEVFYLDTPEVNRAAVELAERNHMKVVFETARMYSGNQPDLPLNRIFGVTSFELG